MINENIVLSLLQASVTGAGLILAIDTLLIPVGRRILQNRTLQYNKKLEEFKSESRRTEGKLTQTQIRKMKTSLDEIEALLMPPNYMGPLLGVSFLGYVFSVLMSLWWILDWNRSTMDALLPLVFGGATILFSVVGLIAIKDIYSVFKEEYEKLKSKIKEVRYTTTYDIDVEK